MGNELSGFSGQNKGFRFQYSVLSVQVSMFGFQLRTYSKIGAAGAFGDGATQKPSPSTGEGWDRGEGMPRNTGVGETSVNLNRDFSLLSFQHGKLESRVTWMSPKASAPTAATHTARQNKRVPETRNLTPET